MSQPVIIMPSASSGLVSSARVLSWTLSASVALLVSACQTTSPTVTGDHSSGGAKALSEIPATVPDPAPNPWLDAHWVLPIPTQGDVPSDWTDLESDLSPQACGTCHPQQLADWQDSWHHSGMGPGVMGQLVDWDDSNDRTVLQCQACHAPMTEQLPATSDGKSFVDNPAVDLTMRAQGLTCAGCHVRQHSRFGPPMVNRQPDADGVALAEGPHGGFVPRAEFQSADFCSVCHDFKQTQLALEGKLLQETGPEWRRTSFAASGVTCQGCHMPEGRHLWKGIHDADMVRKGVEITGGLVSSGSLFSPVQANLKLENVGVGHRLPTYTTPEIKLILVQLDAKGQPLDGTRTEAALGRRITPNLQQELHDTRLLPGESLTLPYAARQHLGATTLQARVEVWPDEAYRRFYEIKLRHPENHPRGQAQLREAMQNSIDSRYVLWQQDWPL